MSEEKKKKGPLLRKITRITGYVIAVISLFYIIWVGYNQWDRIKDLFNFSENWHGILIAIFLYTGLRSSILTLVWKNLITGFGGKITFGQSFTILGRSQIAKYIPGNVFHYLGRHLLCKEIGISNGIIINGMFTETVLFIFSSVFIFLLSAVYYGYANFKFEGINNLIILFAIIFGVIILLALIIYLFIRFIPGIKEKLLKHNMIVNLSALNLKQLWKNLIFSLFLCILFFTATGLIMWFLNNFFWGSSQVFALFFIGVNSIAWVAGFITPGASGGIGIREIVIVALLTPYITQPKALVLAIILRLVTIFGDLLSFLITYIFKNMRK